MSVLSSISCVKSFFLTGVLPQSCFRSPNSVWQMASYVVCTPGLYCKCVCLQHSCLRGRAQLSFHQSVSHSLWLSKSSPPLALSPHSLSILILSFFSIIFVSTSVSFLLLNPSPQLSAPLFSII